MGIVIIVESLLFEWRYHNNPLLPSCKSSHQLKYFRQFIIEYKILVVNIFHYLRPFDK